MSIDHCREMVRAGDPDRFLSAMSAPPEGQGALMVLYAFNLEVARAPWVASEPLIGQMRLQFWHDAIAGIHEGKPPRRHPVVEELAALTARRALPRAPFDALIAARMADLDPAPPETRAALEAYVDATSGGLMQLAARALGTEADAVAADIGRASGMANLMRALPELAVRGHMPLPGLTLADRVALSEGRTTPELAEAVRLLATEARATLRRGRRAARRLPRSVLPALRAGWRAGPLLSAATRPGLDALRDLGPESEFRRRGALLWRTVLGRA
ncbi:phytoene synthase [Paroceanicella profunda]|uniref:Phytoene synthase n=1 Tax=Paroceanicella profunda TaxID=2579971 RepID=A0A5B8G0Q1_9RHOB|nr:squalene/phytoene synthase family protein [Paroceanicella profunda]QDL92642.1 phytoene synthase [Paroceanicella profunda]